MKKPPLGGSVHIEFSKLGYSNPRESEFGNFYRRRIK
jgi:hypothetical protein